jgi:hypothetical protein
MKDKKFTLKFIQIAWVAETIAVLVYTMAVLLFITPERVSLWLQFIPVFAVLIGAQGAAAGAGPLVSDKLKNGGKNE